MATSNLMATNMEVSNGKDSIVVINAVSDLPAGTSLNVSAFNSVEVINAGHIIIKNANGEYAPLGISSGAYASLGNGEAYVGVLKASVSVKDPRAAVLVQGVVNAAASPYPVTNTIKSALPAITFLY